MITTLKQKHLKDTKAVLTKIQAENMKMDVPTIAEIENLQPEYGITLAKYHGGKLNGVDCCEVMPPANTLFEQIETMLALTIYCFICLINSLTRFLQG